MQTINVIRRQTNKVRPNLRFQFDYWLVLALLGLLVMGLLMVYSTTFDYGFRFQDDVTFYFRRQLMAGGLGLVAAVGVMQFDYHILRRFSVLILLGTIGLLIFLAVGTWLDALAFAAELPAFWQGTPLVTFIALIALGLLLVVGARGNRREQTPLAVSYLIALGIGLHNLGEGLAIGAAFSLGEAALGTFLVLGFTLHNITEGVGIAAPIVRQQPPFIHFVLLALLAGGPAILGTWVGGFAFNPVLATIFLAIGIGAILQVIWEVGKLIVRDNTAMGRPLFNWVNLSGVVLGVAIMYFTAFLVKF